MCISQLSCAMRRRRLVALAVMAIFSGMMGYPGPVNAMAASLAADGSAAPALSPVTTGLVGWWQFNEGTGTTAADSSGNGHNATLSNGVSWVTSPTGGGVSANGSSQYVAIPAVNLSATQAITWTAWVNRTYSNAANSVLFEDTANFNSSTTGFGIFPDGDPGTGCSTIAVGLRGNSGYTLSCYAQPPSGTWHHIALVLDKTQTGANVISLYIDGVLKTPTAQRYTTTNTNTFGNDPLYLFSRGGSVAFAVAQVSDLRIYSQVLSAAQIQEIYLQGVASLVSLSVTPGSASVPQGSGQQYTATGTYSDGGTSNLTSSVTWSSSNTTVATINSSGFASALTAGTTTIGASSGTINGSASLTVLPAALVSLAVTPANASILVGGTQQYKATGSYTNGSTQDLTTAVTWTSSTPAVATINSGGLATGTGKGTTNIQAEYASIAGSTSLSVSALPTSIAITPANPSFSVGATVQLTATGMYSDGSTRNLTASATWTSSNQTVATVAGGMVRGVSAGPSTISASWNGIVGSTGVTVSTAALKSIQLAPASAQVAVGATLQMAATGQYDDGSSQDLTSSVTWTTGNNALATITSSGLVSGIAEGGTTVQATQGSVSATLPLAITPTGLVGWWRFNEGSGVTAADSSGGRNSATLVNGISWSSGPIGGAVSANGANQYVSIPSIDLSGTSAVTMAAWVNVAWTTTAAAVLAEDTATFNGSTTGFGVFPGDRGDCGVAGAIMSGLRGNGGYVISCYSPPTTAGWHHLALIYNKAASGSQEVGLYLDGVAQTPLSTPYVVTNSNNFGNNPFYLFARGGSQFFLEGLVSDLRLYNRALTGSEIVQIYALGVPNPGGTLQSIAVTPSSASLSPGGTQQFTASGTYADGSTGNLTGSVTWTSGNTAVATITSGGMATAVTTGSTTIQAASGSIKGTANLNVTTAHGGRPVQWSSGDGGGTNVETVYETNAATNGNMMLILCHWNNQAVSATVHDQMGNTYIPIFPATFSGPSDAFQVWYAKDIKGGVPLTVTINFSGNTTSFSVLDIIEYAGLDPSNPLDAIASATGNSSVQNSGNAVSTASGSETAIGLFGYGGYALPYTAGSGYTMRGYDASTMLEDKQVSAPGTYSATASSNLSSYWAAFLMTFRNAP